MAPAKRARVSKNKKKNWNKVCDIKYVEDFLEEKRFEERIGGAISEKTDDQLYFIQKDAKTDVRRKSDLKTLKCFQNIGAFTKVPPPIKITAEPYSKKIKDRLAKVAERENKRILKASQQTKNVSNKAVLKGDIFCAEIRDLWAEEKPGNPEIEDLINFRDEYTCKKPPKAPGRIYHKPSRLPAVEVPHSGASYNPDYFEHQELLNEAVKIEEAKLKEEMHLKRVLDDMFPSKEEAPTEESILEEMSQGLFEQDNDEENATENTFVSYNPPVSFENRVTKKYRRKRRERNELERVRREAKMQKQRLSQIYRIKSLKKEIKMEAAAAQKTAEKTTQRRIDGLYKPKVLSQYKYEAPDLEVNLTDELCSSMRTLKTEGNLLEDRYKSLQRRNLIETRIKQKFKRKYKLKILERRTHRDF
ncbi:ribosome biogenesis protein NOP53 [Nephila pilipes]|uniref:Ribosome biogenesis protein NOP53 n=1 Tax=Nephila pilipes TaxID=299642 RepID=A0A8X6TDH8_NEPPI|nr:ribosome biogenesis protein NOP53 [Nephila pilipes]